MTGARALYGYFGIVVQAHIIFFDSVVVDDAEARRFGSKANSGEPSRPFCESRSAGTCAIRNGSAAKENTQGRHYTPKSALRAT